jgi:hypothetical protein
MAANAMEFELVKKLDGGGGLYRPVPPLSFAKALDLLEGSKGGVAFIEGIERLIIGAGKDEGMPAVFFECPPARAKSLESQGFEFVVIPTNELRTETVNLEDVAFREHLVPRDNNDLVVTFESLGRDATMVAPLPDASEDATTSKFSHLKAFLENADIHRRTALWQEVSRSFRARLISAKDGGQVWLSTHGGGVPYLHVRICEKPRYYHHDAFAKMVV